MSFFYNNLTVFFKQKVIFKYLEVPMRLIVSIALIVIMSFPVVAQEVNFVELDSLYREDQVYVGVTYNLLGNKPAGVSQNGFSSGFHLGFIRDIPLNKKRNFALGVGIGYSGNSFNQNLKIAKDEAKNINYSVLTDNDNFTKNKFAMHMLEIPIEFRWRSSTVADYKFWRIYAGLKAGYLFTHTTKFEGAPENQLYSNIDHFNNVHYGISASLGYNTWNFHLYYGLNSIFNEDAILESKSINMKAIKIGLMFYLL